MEGFRNLVADIKDMFVSEKQTDVKIKVKEEIFAAHRSVLSARSPVLAAMLKHDMIEKKTGQINISDCDPKAFRHFLFYLYSGKLEDSEKCDFFHLYKIADKYEVPELKLVCIDYLTSNITVHNFCETYIFADHFNDEKLLVNLLIFFNENFYETDSDDCMFALIKENVNLANNLLKMLNRVKDKK